VALCPQRRGGPQIQRRRQPKTKRRGAKAGLMAVDDSGCRKRGCPQPHTRPFLHSTISFPCFPLYHLSPNCQERSPDPTSVADDVVTSRHGIPPCMPASIIFPSFVFHLLDLCPYRQELSLAPRERCRRGRRHAPPPTIFPFPYIPSPQVCTTLVLYPRFTCAPTARNSPRTPCTLQTRLWPGTSSRVADNFTTTSV
jgi:hypothetical protein